LSAVADEHLPGLEATEAECKKINPNIETAIISCDITSAGSVASLASDTKSRFGRLDVVVVNSGYSGPMIPKVTDTDPETFQNAINV
jgi:NAD(P)-dependent dehydrogenase (short-subunit alcohol dehydrogenase family)